MGEGGMSGLLSHPSSYLNPSHLSKPPSPPPLWISPPAPTMNLPPCSHYESIITFFQQQFLMERVFEMKGNSSVVFWFHFWHLLISNLNGYQEQISSYSPAPSYQVPMQMHPICYLEWRCLVLKDADSLSEKIFSPANDKGQMRNYTSMGRLPLWMLPH